MKLPTEWRYYWCKACEMGGCGCMGCVNISGLSRQGLETPITEAEWNTWVAENPAVPKGVYYGTDTDNFYNDATKEGQGEAFHKAWISRKQEFPQKKTEGIPIQDFAAKSPENARIVAEIIKGLEDGTLVLS